MNTLPAPVITIDGPAAAGKGTVSKAVAKTLHFHLLDSGRLYRAAALAALSADIKLDNPSAVVAVVRQLSLDNERLQQLLNATALRSDATAETASALAANAAVRQALICLQRAARRPPGLVADGRDMGSVIFPNAAVKIYLTADLDERAKRRMQQLNASGIPATIVAARDNLQSRDNRDASRLIAPLKPAVDALIIDSTRTTVDDIAQHIVRIFHASHRLSTTPPLAEGAP